jgi:hypothetical protein
VPSCGAKEAKLTDSRLQHQLDGVVVEMFVRGVVVAAVVVTLTMLCVVLEVSTGAV